jgi:hypothetical protein
MKFLLVLCLSACIVLSFAKSKVEEKCLPDHEVVKEILKNYEKLQAPEGVTDVEVAMWLQDIEEICSKKGAATLSLYLNGKWTDPRLNFNKLNPCHTNISLTKETYDKLWNPRLVVTDSRTFSIYESPVPSIFTLIFENGTVWVCNRVKLDAVCSFESKDKATCSLSQESFVGNENRVKLHWAPDGFFSIVDPTKTIWKMTNHQTKHDAPLYPAGIWHKVTLSMDFMKNKKPKKESDESK